MRISDWSSAVCSSDLPNPLIIRLQPEENIRLLIMAKQPGLYREAVEQREVGLNVRLDAAFAKTRRRIAYERLILYLLEGDPTLIVRADEVEAAWAWIDSIHHGGAAADMEPVKYAAGTWGPVSAQIGTA